MNTENWVTLASLLFSVFAFAWATVATWQSSKNGKHLQEFELKTYKDKDEEKKKALIEARVYKLDDWWSINVYNRGLGTARNIRFYSPEIEDENKSGIILCMDNRQMPYPFLHNGGSFEIKAVLAEGHKPIAIAKFTWDDEYENNNERELVLNF
jgi:hypothetical protein